MRRKCEVRSAKCEPTRKAYGESIRYALRITHYALLFSIALLPLQSIGQSNSSGALVVPAPSTNAAASAPPATLMDIKAPVEIPDYWLYFWIALSVLAAVIAGFLIWKYWLKKKFEPPPIPPMPPHVRARRRLREAMAHISEPKVFVSVVSDAVRFYLEESFHLRAPERTTEEFLHELQSSNRLGDNVKRSLGEFLNRCDMVKFAKYEPTQLELEDLHNAAMRIIEETEPKPILTNQNTPLAPALQEDKK